MMGPRRGALELCAVVIAVAALLPAASALGGDGYCPTPDPCTSTPNMYCVADDISDPSNTYWYCDCQVGWRRNDTTGVCEDVNECTEWAGTCSNGNCTNTVGSYNCSCPNPKTSYQVINGVKQCVPLDACKTMASKNLFPCAPGTCNDTLTSNQWGYICTKCEPYPKYTLALGPSGPFCKATPCATAVCPSNSNCVLNFTSSTGYTCACKTGYRWNPATSKCDDIKECSEVWHACLNGTCNELPGSYNCTCPLGYNATVTSGGTKVCAKINMCAWLSARNLAPCLSSDRCYNVMNNEWGYNCYCPTHSPWHLAASGPFCQITRCSYEPCGDPRNHTCVVNATSPLGYSCKCAPGYVMIAGRCVLDACINVKCGPHGRCLANLNGAVCICENGWASPNASIPCSVCAPGYVYNATSGRCEDVNECARSPNPCGPIGVRNCTNTLGSYRCSCFPGYEAVQAGTKCQDYNECTRLPQPCFNSTGCINTNGSYTCTCKPGFEQRVANGVRYCLDTNECQRYAVFGVCENGLALNPCTNLAGGYRCNCPAGFARVNVVRTWAGVSRNVTICRDVNECRSPLLNSCGPGGSCINLEGTYSCNCTRPGYVRGFDNLGRPACRWNPCQYWGAAASCGAAANAGSCYNMPNVSTEYPRGYACNCNTPMYVQYGKNTTSITCILNRCLYLASSNPCGLGTCVNKPSSCQYTCVCPLGYFIPSGTCPKCQKLVILPLENGR